MANMDNKIAFQEHEYPVLDNSDGQIEQTDSDDDIPIDFNAKTRDCEVIETSHSKTNKNQVSRPTTRTRSRKEKSKQLTCEKKHMNDKTTAPTKTRKRRAKDIYNDDNNEQMIPPLAKRTTTSIESTNNSLDAVTELTSTTLEINRLHDKFKKIFEEKENVELDRSAICIMGCQRNKSTVLLPCRHQPTCKQCFVMWKIFIDQFKKETFCPICKVCVSTTIVINDE